VTQIVVWRIDGVTSLTGGGWDSALTNLLRVAGADVTTVDPYVDDPLSIDAAGHVLSGGATSVASTPQALCALGHARRLVDLADRTGVPVVGICLGMQTLAAAIVGRPCSGPSPNGIEVGVVDVRSFDSVWRVATFHSHVVSDDLRNVPGVQVVATNAHTPIQAFEVGSISGVQFHPEMSRLDLAAAAEANPTWIQNPHGVVESVLGGADPTSAAPNRWILNPLGLGVDTELPSPPLAA
jgi:GMP synthase (glutamine-hydrolysing)